MRCVCLWESSEAGYVCLCVCREEGYLNVCVQKSGLFRMCVYVPTDEEKVALLLRHEAELAAEQAKRTMTLRQRRD